MTLKPEMVYYEGLLSPAQSSPMLAEGDATQANSLSTTAPLRGVGVIRSSRSFIRRRGHTLSFAGLFLFTVILYLRPYELIPALSSFTSMAFYTGLVTLIVFVITQLGKEGNLTARPREVNLALLLGVAAFLSIPGAINPGEAWLNFSELYIKSLLIFIVLANVVRTEFRLRLLLLFCLGVSLYLSINAIQDYQSGIFTIGKAVNNNLRVAGRIKGLFENSNDLALHLVTMTPIAIAMAFVKPGTVRKVVYLSVALIMVAAIVVTFSRGGFLGLVAMTLVIVHKLGRKQRVSAISALIFAVVLFFAFAPGDYGGRISTIFDSGADVTGSSSQRNLVLQRSVLVALRHPLLGVGIGNFHHQSLQELGTHNAYTQVAAEMGIISMVIYMMFVMAPLKRLRDIERETYIQPENRRFYYLAIGLQASLIGFMVSSFFGAVAYQWYLYYLVGYAYCLHRIFNDRFTSENNQGSLIIDPLQARTD